MVQQQVFFQSVSFANNLVLRAENLACARGARKVFAQLDFQLKAGEAMAVYGANGSGKTSLLRLIAGFLTPRDGALSLSGDGHEATQCHYLGHTDGLKANLTVAETLSFTARIFGHDGAALDLSMLGLTAHQQQMVGDLSAGQKRRLMLARLFIAPRQIWLLDEPLTALDEQGRQLIDQLAQDHLATGGMIIAASHERLGFAGHRLQLNHQTHDMAAV